MSSAQTVFTPMSDFLCQYFPGLVLIDRKFVESIETTKFQTPPDIRSSQVESAMESYWRLRDVMVHPIPGGGLRLAANGICGFVAISDPVNNSLIVSVEF